ncbi:MAG: glycosyltransferase [Acidimicrobiales bacterium]
MTSPPRRVALVTNGLTRAGAETQLMRLASTLRAHGDEVKLLSILATEAFGDELDELGIPTVELVLRPGMKAMSAIWAGSRVLRAWRPDVAISFVYQANILGRVAGRVAGVPVIVSSVRNEHFGGRHRELAMRVTDRLSSVTTTNSELAAQSLVSRGIVPRHRLVVIPNGIDVAPFSSALSERATTRARLEVAADSFVWLAAGRLEPQKDYSTLLAALARCREARRPHQLLIAGQGRLRSELERQAADLGLGDRVRFLGVRGDIPDLIGACDAVVLSSRWEGLPNVVMEAMAGGRPVVSTRVGGAPELVEDGVTGRLVPPGAAGPLAEAMTEVMTAPNSQRQTMGARGRAIVAERYSPVAVGDRWLQLLDAYRDPR